MIIVYVLTWLWASKTYSHYIAPSNVKFFFSIFNTVSVHQETTRSTTASYFAPL